MATFVIVHGAWGGGWEWREVEARLRAAGHEVNRPTLTGLGERSHLLSPAIDLDTHVTDVLAVLEFEDLRDVVLVGHSYGGMVVSGVVDRDAAGRVARVVFVDALVPRDGECVLDLVPPPLAQELRSLAGGGDALPLPVPHEQAVASRGAWYAERGRDHPFRTFTQPIRLRAEPGAGRPCAYIRTTAEPDTVALLELSVSRAGEAGWPIEEIATHHDPQVADPAGLTALLVTAAAA